MTPWNPQANKIMLAALEITDPVQRKAYVGTACGENDDLRVAVEALLVSHDRAGQFLSSHTGSDAVSEDQPTAFFPIGTQLAGKYEIQRPLGEGGMGVVLLARQSMPVQREVAIKLIKTNADVRRIRQRFAQERNALALMDHPNIARIYDAGVVSVLDGRELLGESAQETEHGIPYFAMEYISGAPITDYCDRHRLDVRARLELFVSICEAVQHAHQKGIVHRDLKPSNILVTTIDGKPTAKVIDFGVAKLTDSELVDEPMHTSFGNLVGTLEYMSPEQAQRSSDIDTRTDVYALGAILYEILSGTVPHSRERLHQAGLDEMLRIIREESPVPPSSQLSHSGALPNIASDRAVVPQRLIRWLRGDLDWIVLKALEKERDRRYDSVAGFADDVRRFLSQEPVSARPPSATYRLQKAYRRHRVAFWAAGTAMILLAAGVIGTSAGYVSASRNALRAGAETRRAVAAEQATQLALEEVAQQRDEAQTQAQIANAISDFLLVDLLRQANLGAQAARISANEETVDYDRELKRDPSLLELVDRAAAELSEDRIESKFPNQPVVQARLLLEIGFVYNSLAQFHRALPLLERSFELFENTTKQAHENGRVRDEHDQRAILNRGRHPLGAGRDGLASLRALSFAARGVGRVDESLEYAKQYYERAVAALGETHERSIQALTRLAHAYQGKGNNKRAIELDRQAVALCDRPDVVSDDRVELKAVCQLALCVRLIDAGRYEPTVPILEEVYLSRKQRLGPSHPKTSNSGLLLASAYHRLMQPDLALPLYEEIVPRTVELYGSSHPKALNAMESLASCYHRLGQTERAVGLYDELLPLRIQRDGRFHVDTLRTFANRGINLLEIDRLEQALPDLSFVREHGMKSPQVHWAIRPLHETLFRLGRIDEAERLSRDYLDLVRKDFADRPKLLRLALFTVASHYFQQEEYAIAETHLRELIALNEKNDKAGWNSFNAKAMLGRTLMLQEKTEEAEPLLLEGYEGMKQREQRIPLPVQHHLADARMWLAECYEALGKEEAAAELTSE